LSPSELHSFLLKSLRQKHTLLTLHPTPSDFRLNLCQNRPFQNQNLRTLKLSSVSMATSSSNQGTSRQRVCARKAEGSYEENLDNKTSPWNEVVNMTMFNSTKKAKYCDLKMQYKLLQKIMSENLLSKGGGVDQPSLEHRVFLHFLITLKKENVAKYIFNHMLWALKESQDNNRSWIPYGRLLSKIFH